MEIALVIPYVLVLGLLCTLGAHRAHMVYLLWRNRGRLAQTSDVRALPEAALPFVTIQLPLYNEATVAARLIAAAGQIDYPRDRFEIQVLDDSTDETRAIASAKVEELALQGIQATYVRRADRVGYKAGALDHGLGSARGEFITIFDADFVPQPGFLKSLMGHFSDPKVGMVQARWGHMNRDVSFLTRIQALMLDGHHLVENRARFGAGLFFNFAGTGGVWRRSAIEIAGGWQHDTITEDLDLSYRAQMAGYRFIYRADVATPAELPEEMSAFRAQQHRWAKGTVQTARKLLGRIMRERLPLSQRIEACFHMLPHFAYPLMLVLTVLLLPALLLLPASDVRTMLLIDLPLCVGATGSLVLFYATAEYVQGRSIWFAIRKIPLLIAIGAGLAPHLTKAVLAGMTSMAGEFVRTPKRGEALGRYRQAAQLPLAEMALALLSAANIVAAVETGHWFAAPFAALFMVGYAGVAFLVMREQVGARRASLAPAFNESGEVATEVARAA